MSTPIAEGYHPATEPPAAASSLIADPAPLGLAGFAMTTLILSLANNKVWPAGATAAVSLALFYGGGAQLLAGMWEFKRGNTFGATAFSSYGAFWLSFWYLSVKLIPGLEANHATAGDVPVVVGTFLMGWTIFTAYMTIATLRLNMALVVVFTLLTLTFLCLTIGAFHSSDGWNKLGGWIGVATAAAAWYTSFAIILRSTFDRDVLPVYPYSA
jgi:succinate-acetate transporter protein